MQKKMDYKAPDAEVIYIVPVETICATSKYTMQYPDGNPATHGGRVDYDPLYPTQRYGGSSTEIWK